MTDGIKLVASNPVATALLQNPSEDNVALAFAQAYGGTYVFPHGKDKWCRWDGTRWQEDETKTMLDTIRALTRNYNPGGKAAFARSGFFSGVERILQTDRAFSRRLADFDRNNYLLNTPEGTYDLHTGERREHDPLDKITKLTSCSPRSEGGKVFLKFVDEVTDGDKDLADFLQTSLGACLSGAVEEHWLMVWIGSGRNGKNTLGDLVLDIMGDYAKVIPSSTLMVQKNTEHKTELMNLRGMRLVVSGEIEQDAQWAEARMKELTGDTEISGRFMRQDLVTFARTHKHLIYGNHRPQLKNTDTAVRSRMRLVPFNVSFAGREDADLPRKLRLHKGFVLHWLMEGHARWVGQGRKIGSCKAVDAETADYMSSQSSVEQWVIECCEVSGDRGKPHSYWESGDVLYRSFCEWREKKGETYVPLRVFGESLRTLYTRKRSNGMRYVGIKELKKPGNNACYQKK